MSQLVVCDTGPLIHLEQRDALSLLELTGEVVVPKTILDELERRTTGVSDLEFSVEPADVDIGSAYPHLDPGETAALVICIERDAMFLTDDMDARNTATDEGVGVHGSVGVVLYGYSEGVLTEETAQQLPRGLKRGTSLYLSALLVEHAIESVESDDAGW